MITRSLRDESVDQQPLASIAIQCGCGYCDGCIRSVNTRRDDGLMFCQDGTHREESTSVSTFFISRTRTSSAPNARPRRRPKCCFLTFYAFSGVFPSTSNTTTTTITMPRERGIHTPHLKGEDRKRIYILYHDACMTKVQIKQRTGYTDNQIRTAIRDPTLKPRSGRPPFLNADQHKELDTFFTASKANRFMTFLELSMCLFGGIFGVYSIRSALRRLGFSRRIARRKPPIDEDIRDLRLEWAHLHKDWAFEQWAQILWTDETWVTGGTHRRQFMTRRVGEELNPDCIDERPRKKKGWMFWGCFSGLPGRDLAYSGRRIGARSTPRDINNTSSLSSTAGSDYAGRRMERSSLSCRIKHLLTEQPPRPIISRNVIYAL